MTKCIRFFQPGADFFTPACQWIEEKEFQGSSPESLVIFLPNSRTCRYLMQEILKRKSNEASLLPHLISMGDFHSIAELLPLHAQAALPKPIPNHLRRVLLARLLSATKEHNLSFGGGYKIAQSISQLLDQLAAQGLELTDLTQGRQGDAQDYSAHWDLNFSFLKNLENIWPQLLSQLGFVDPATYHHTILEALGHMLQDPGEMRHFLLLGSTGSQHVTQELMAHLNTSPRGELWLYTPHADAQNLPEVHPYYFPTKTARNLSAHHEIDTKTAHSLPQLHEAWLSLASLHAMSPKKHKEVQALLTAIDIFEAETPQEEALTVAQIAAQKLCQFPDKQIIIICPDARLTKKICFALETFGVKPDDAQGTPLAQTSLGNLYFKVFDALVSPLLSIDLIDLLCHPLTTFSCDAKIQSCRLILEKTFRLPFTQRPHLYKTVLTEEALSPLRNLYQQSLEHKKQSIENWTMWHQDILHQILKKGISLEEHPDFLQAKEALKEVNQQLREMSPFLDPLSVHDYRLFLQHYMESVPVRPTCAHHPRLLILDTREARLLPKDCVILAGLNKGIWPRPSPQTPWVPIPLAKKFNLATPDALLSLMGHDFLSHLSTADVTITYAKKNGNLETPPSPFVARLKAVAHATNCSLEKKLSPFAHKPRAPMPPLTLKEEHPSFPRKISLTALEALSKGTLLPEELLYKGTMPLSPYLPFPSPQEKGILLHQFLANEKSLLLEGWHTPEKTAQALHKKLGVYLKAVPHHAEIQGLWKEQWKQALSWLCHFQASRSKPLKIFTETDGHLQLTVGSHVVLIRARMDRIDLMPGGHLHLWDYKTGRTATRTEVMNHQALQLTYGSHMIHKNAFHTSGLTGQVAEIGYLSLSGKHQGGTHLSLPLDEAMLQGVCEHVEQLLHTLAQAAANTIPYLPQEGGEYGS